jgi:hypothetical protein
VAAPAAAEVVALAPAAAAPAAAAPATRRSERVSVVIDGVHDVELGCIVYTVRVRQGSAALSTLSTRYSELRSLWEVGPRTVPFPSKRLLKNSSWVVAERVAGMRAFLEHTLATHSGPIAVGTDEHAAHTTGVPAAYVAKVRAFLGLTS